MTTAGEQGQAAGVAELQVRAGRAFVQARRKRALLVQRELKMSPWPCCGCPELSRAHLQAGGAGWQPVALGAERGAFCLLFSLGGRLPAARV